jgi:hypothetical protein
MLAGELALKLHMIANYDVEGEYSYATNIHFAIQMGVVALGMVGPPKFLFKS